MIGENYVWHKKKQQKQECGHDPNFRGIYVNISLDTVSYQSGGGGVGHED